LTTYPVPSDQSCLITVTYGGKTALAAITIKKIVVAKTLTGIVVYSGQVEVNESSSAQYTCQASYSDGTTAFVTSSANWSINSNYAVISAGTLTTYPVPSDQSCLITVTYGGKTALAQITIKKIVVAKTLTGIVVYSGQVEVNESSSAQYTCQASYSDGTTAFVTSSANWSINSDYATISGGTLTTYPVPSDQSCLITVTYGGKTALAAITIKKIVVAKTLTGIVVYSGQVEVNESSSAQYTCQASYSDGTTAFVTSSANWSINSNYAVISAGTLTTYPVPSDQSCLITVTYGGKTALAQITIKKIVVAKTLTGIVVYSGQVEVNESSSAQYTCQASYSDGTTAFVTSSANWSINSDYATISGGTLTTYPVPSDQSCLITVTYGGKTALAAITIKKIVVAKTLTGIVVYSGQVEVNESSSAQYTCQASYSDGTTAFVTSSANWSINSNYAVISAGTLTTYPVPSDQSCLITVTYGGKTALAQITIKKIVVAKTLTGIVVYSGQVEVNESSSAQYTCQASYSDGTTAFVTSSANWSINSNYAVISAGTLTTYPVPSDQSCLITVTYGGKTALAQITIKKIVVAKTLTGIVVYSGQVEVNESSSAQYTCQASYSDGTTAFVTSSANWSINSNYAVISAGTLTTYPVPSDQSCLITVTYGGKTALAQITIKKIVVAKTLTGIVVYSGQVEVNESSSAQYTCQASYSDGTTAFVTSSANWSINSNYATISGGTLTTYPVPSDQSCLITVTYGGKTALAQITIKKIVVAKTLTGIVVYSGQVEVNESSSAQYTCQASYSDGTTAFVTSSANWSINSNYAVISAGTLTTYPVPSDQSCLITVTYGGKTALAQITIKKIVVAKTLTGIVVYSGQVEVNESSSAQYTCQASYSDGTTAFVTSSANWS